MDGNRDGAENGHQGEVASFLLLLSKSTNPDLKEDLLLPTITHTWPPSLPPSQVKRALWRCCILVSLVYGPLPLSGGQSRMGLGQCDYCPSAKGKCGHKEAHEEREGDM